jgi:hypothetical protein
MQSDMPSVYSSGKRPGTRLKPGKTPACRSVPDPNLTRRPARSDPPASAPRQPPPPNRADRPRFLAVFACCVNTGIGEAPAVRLVASPRGPCPSPDGPGEVLATGADGIAPSPSRTAHYRSPASAVIPTVSASFAKADRFLPGDSRGLCGANDTLLANRFSYWLFQLFYRMLKFISQANTAVPTVDCCLLGRHCRHVPCGVPKSGNGGHSCAKPVSTLF